MTIETTLQLATSTGLTEATPALSSSSDICPLAVELGTGFTDPALAAFKPALIAGIAQVRQTLSADLGFTIPSIAIDTVSEIGSLQYNILIRGVIVSGATLYPTQIMAINTGSVTMAIGGTPTTDPVFGNPAVWIDPSWAPQATACGYAVVDPSLVIATHLGEIVRQHARELLDWDNVQSMIDGLSPAYRALVPTTFALGEIHQLLGDLIDESVSIRDLPAILEGAWQGRKEQKPFNAILEVVRGRLALSISAKYRADDGAIHAVTLAPIAENALRARITHGLQGAALTLDAVETAALSSAINLRVQALQIKGFRPVLVCHPDLRGLLHRLLDHDLSELQVLSTDEVARGFTVTVEETVDTLLS